MARNNNQLYMRDFKFYIGDLLKYNKDGWISPIGCPDKHYTRSLRVEFRFWDGKQNVYVVTAEDGLGMFSRETLRSEAWLLGYSFAKAHKQEG